MAEAELRGASEALEQGLTLVRTREAPKNKRTILRRRMKWMDRLALPDRSITWAPQARMQPKRWASIEQGMTVHVHDSIEEWTAMPRHSVRCVVTEQRTAEHSPTRACQQRLRGASTSAVEADSAYERDHSYCGEYHKFF